ncbi:hypothetical protein N5D77_24960 [Comamonas thiooxydans]|uniref:Uncharacterized protein n=1 Tax=Comamonas thiooxydans TaxID=363952 RepID=A0AA42TX70_9BURK|nr:hypothetical protein [Comamonas thiooxydans]MDH1337098.1 hypothetical protein [Comamonas thiooxydans]MDH1743284.1 hypothetical protein [Comamonas thiooxydans]MDH1789816.1 hypothetical protein [Comamonas thiooxydans]
MLYQPRFPQALSDTAAALLQRLGKSQAFEPYPGFTISINGELLHAPYRVYYDKRELQQCIQESSGPTQQLALCLGSRHANGKVREACLRQLLEHGCNWVLPFVVRAAGEYVLEIAEHLAAQTHRLLPNSYGRFAAENPEFVITCKQQAASYWDCYHRQRYPLLRQHPGIRFLRWVDEARRSLPHAD